MPLNFPEPTNHHAARTLIVVNRDESEASLPWKIILFRSNQMD